MFYKLCYFSENLQDDFLFVIVKNAQKYYYENCVTYDICDGVPGKTAKSTVQTFCMRHSLYNGSVIKRLVYSRYMYLYYICL